MDAAESSGWQLLGYLAPEPNASTEERFRVPHLGNDNDLEQLLSRHPSAQIILGMGAPLDRRKGIVEAFDIPQDRWAKVIHPTATISPHATVGEGVFIGARSVLQVNSKIGCHGIVNTQALIEHDVQLGDYSHIAPGALTGGGCLVGNCTLIGIGAKLRDHVRVGNDCTVGAGAVVISNIADGLTVAGVPAVVIRPRNKLNLDGLCIPPTTSLFDAVAVVAREGALIALVVDEQKKLLGVLTDGDIRRALLAQQDFSIPVAAIMSANFIAAREAVSRAKAIDLMRAHEIGQLPVLDDKGRVVGLHFLGGWLGSGMLDVAAVIMAGGKGTRLRPLTETIPKPMVRVAGRPILEHIILHLSGSNVRDIYIAVNHLGNVIEDYFGDGHDFGCRITYLREGQPLGTGGALSLLRDTWPIDRPLLVLNGDLITQVNVGDLVDAHVTAGNLITVGIRDHAVEIPYGVIEVDRQRVVQLVEKPTHHYLVNAGIYLLSPAVLDHVPRDREFPITDLIEQAISRNEPVGVHLIDGDWADVGQHADLALARGYHT